jgi:hypothetical protein
MLLGTTAALAHTPPCTPKLTVGAECEALIEQLRPTQPEVGMREVERKTEKVEKARERGDEYLEELKREKIVPVVIGPDGGFYLVDHHHSTLAFQNAGEKKVYIQIIANWSDLSQGKPSEIRLRSFWNKMIAECKAWTRRENGTEVDPMGPGWPRRLDDCGDSPLRALVSELIDDELLEKKAVNFFEFQVAEILKNHGISVGKMGHRDAYKKAKKFLKSADGKAALNHLNSCLRDVARGLP